MRLNDLTQRTGQWLREDGPSQDVVISSRVRLARNLAGMPFLPKCSHEQLGQIEQRLRNEIMQANVAEEMFYFDVAAAGDIERQLLVERHLISRQHAEGDRPRGVAISSDESIAIMVNEEDHLRIQILRSGLQLAETIREINRIDDLLEQRLSFSFHSRYGYLTACPTNVGTGMRLSVMLHLPVLKMTGEINKLFQAAKDMRVAVRGLHGEGTEASGDFFQVSNQTTLGRSEEQIAREFSEQIIPAFIEYEKRARQTLLAKRPASLDDKIHRALALLRSARVIQSGETLYLLSLVRMGANLGRLKDVPLATINELFLLTQPAHLQKILQQELSPEQRDEARATYIRQRLGSL